MTEAERQISMLLAQAQMDRDAAATPSALASALTKHIPEEKQRFGRWQPEALASGETAKAGIVGKLLGALGLDASGNRAATSWGDAAKHTAGNIINAPQDIGNQLLDLQDYQPVYGTGASNPEDRARAGQQAVSTFGLAGLAPLGGVMAGRAARPTAGLQDGAGANPSAQLNQMLRGEGHTPGTVMLPKESFLVSEGNYSPIRGQWLEDPPGQDVVARRLDGSALYANSKEGAVPGLLSQAGERVQALYEPSNQVNIFGGQNAKTADQAKLKSAMDMAAAGLPREQIWSETGWFTGADGKWRFEIDDSGQKLRKTLDELDRSNPMPTDMVFSHDQLYQAYPQVGDIPWYRTPSMENGGGSYDATSGIRVGSGEGLASGKNGVGGVTLHEQQHAVQGIEGFARGSNKKRFQDVKEEQMMLTDANILARTASAPGATMESAKAFFREIMKRDPVLGAESVALSGEAPAAILKRRDSLLSPEENYRRTAGETEARTVQKRMDLTADQRAARPPWLDYDVPENQQIVRFNDTDTTAVKRLMRLLTSD